jgi:hypothetical protein
MIKIPEGPETPASPDLATCKTSVLAGAVATVVAVAEAVAEAAAAPLGAKFSSC